MFNRLRLTDRIFTLLSRSTRLNGLWIGSLGSDSKELEAVKAALELIKFYDAGRYSQIVRDINRIWVVPLIGSIGKYNHAIRTCKIDSRYVESAPVDAIALVIVHEATHARLHKFGYTEELRPRIERLCVLNERAFARKLPDRDELVAWVEQQLAHPNDYSDRGLIERKKLAAVREAQDLRLPRWLIHRSWIN